MPHAPTRLPDSLAASRDGDVAILLLNRPAKRNAVDMDMIRGVERFFTTLSADIRAVLIHGAGQHFCAGLDLSTLQEADMIEGMMHSREWHRVFQSIEFGRVPVVSALHGAVIGGGLELACSTHIRVADATTFYALPEGQRGIFVGGGGAVRLPRLIGVHRMMDMMLTGRTYGAEEGRLLGFSQYFVPAGESYAQGLEIARKLATNAPMTNFAIMQALPRIAETDPATGLLLESLVSSAAQQAPEAKQRLRDFLEKRAPKVKHSD